MDGIKSFCSRMKCPLMTLLKCCVESASETANTRRGFLTSITLSPFL
ncbi:hypothetical protein JMJ77_0004932, partial [Colletotrichum scovillei]